MDWVYAHNSAYGHEQISSIALKARPTGHFQNHQCKP